MTDSHIYPNMIHSLDQRMIETLFHQEQDAHVMSYYDHLDSEDLHEYDEWINQCHEFVDNNPETRS